MEYMMLERNIEYLTAHSCEYINKLEPNSVIYETFHKFKNYVDSIDNKHDYIHLINILKSQYRPTHIEAMTIGSYLYGCLQFCYGDAEKVCSPLCIHNIKEKFEGSASCSYQVWMSFIDEYIQLIKNNSNHAYIYVDDNFKYFKKEDIEKFKAAGLDFAQLLKTCKSKHLIFLKMTHVDKLPLLSTPNINNNSRIDNTSIYQKYQPSYNFIFALGLILIILISMLVFINIKHAKS